MGMETHDGGGKEAVSRAPLRSDLKLLCGELNRRGARYVVVGGLAIIHHGFQRLTNDVDLLIETTKENEEKVIQSLLILPDQAARELKAGEIVHYGVVRVGDEILVDLMTSGCGVTYADAVQDAVIVDIDGVQVPFASAQVLWRMKQTVRVKDIPDRLFLRELLSSQGIKVESDGSESPDSLMRLWSRVKGWFKS